MNRSDERVFELAAKNRGHTVVAQHRGVERRIETVRHEPHAGIERAHPGDDGHGQTRRGVHRKKERDHCRAAHRVLAQPFLGQIGAEDFRPGRPQRSRRRGEAERLTADVVRRDEEDH